MKYPRGIMENLLFRIDILNRDLKTQEIADKFYVTYGHAALLRKQYGLPYNYTPYPRGYFSTGKWLDNTDMVFDLYQLSVKEFQAKYDINPTTIAILRKKLKIGSEYLRDNEEFIAAVRNDKSNKRLASRYNTTPQFVANVRRELGINRALKYLASNPLFIEDIKNLEYRDGILADRWGVTASYISLWRIKCGLRRKKYNRQYLKKQPLFMDDIKNIDLRDIDIAKKWNTTPAYIWNIRKKTGVK